MFKKFLMFYPIIQQSWLKFRVHIYYLSVMYNSLPCNVTCQATLSMEFSRQEYWSGCHALLQKVFPAQGLNSLLLY